MSFIKSLLNSVSRGALFSVAAADVDARTNNDRIFGLRPTPRHPERHPGFKTASPKRARQRRQMRALYERRLAREKAIGVNPKYRNGSRDENAALIGNWVRSAQQWNKAHPVKVDG